ncbi:hypothetical protein E1B28_009398 [Marasmius oreades]|uniref:DUF985 domain-containing protein n=1 Tax=Marasmius oreades TaxID=181124 RepID=A0A9P7S0X6_9AGAR|nr:uncharacterized protein E1B28_009398 [Marasmius oreades]KAG7093113.1 hypothetical protein E1B28_009398 [Marasmius oreades]
MAASVPTDLLISQLGLQTHPAGGYFLETDRQKTEIASPFRPDAAQRSLATTIYYLLTKDSPTGIILRTKAVSYHIHHQGRMEYTLITPGSPLKIEKKILGTDTANGESRLIVVDPGVWKFARLLPEDLKDEARAKEGCLMTMLLVPGFDFEDHEFLTAEGLESLFGGGAQGGKEYIQAFSDHVWKN